MGRGVRPGSERGGKRGGRSISILELEGRKEGNGVREGLERVTRHSCIDVRFLRLKVVELRPVVYEIKRVMSVMSVMSVLCGAW